jgi:hypothetical protein
VYAASRANTSPRRKTKTRSEYQTCQVFSALDSANHRSPRAFPGPAERSRFPIPLPPFTPGVPRSCRAFSVPDSATASHPGRSRVLPSVLGYRFRYRISPRAFPGPVERSRFPIPLPPFTPGVPGPCRAFSVPDSATAFHLGRFQVLPSVLGSRFRYRISPPGVLGTCRTFSVPGSTAAHQRRLVPIQGYSAVHTRVLVYKFFITTL